jgi:hypothetical protein
MRRAGSGRAARQRGSVLILVPALVLVLLVLGAICIDSATEWLGHRSLEDFATSAADQAASAALDKGAFYGDGQPGGQVIIDAQDAAAVVAQVREVSSAGGLTITATTVMLSPDGQTVTVLATGTVPDIFGPAVGGRSRVTLTARASATLEEVRVGRPG